MLLIHKGYCVVKKLVGNVRIKAFWYTNIIPNIHHILILINANFVSFLNPYTIYIKNRKMELDNLILICTLAKMLTNDFSFITKKYFMKIPVVYNTFMFFLFI